MNRMFFHPADGSDDYRAILSLWPERFGKVTENVAAQSLIANAIRSGTALIARGKDGDVVFGATVLDFQSYANSLFVPFVLINEELSNRAFVQRKLLELIVDALIHSRVGRIVFAMDKTKAHEKAFQEFNRIADEKRIPARVEVLGSVADLYGDGRTVTMNALFISEKERPDLVTGITDDSVCQVEPNGETDTGSGDEDETVGTMAAAAPGSPASPIVGIGAGVLRDQLMAAACCSGCNEKKDKDKEGKDKEIVKEVKDIGKDQESFSKLSPEKSNIDSVGLYTLYERLGVKRFDRYATARFAPLV